MQWNVVRLGDIGKWGSGGTPLSSVPDYYQGPIPWLITEDLNDGTVKTAKKNISELGLKNSSAVLLKPGTLLMAMYGSIGKLGITGMECATNQAIAYCVCNPSKVDLKFLFYYLLFSRADLIRMGKGVTQQNISQTVIKDYPIHLPSIKEQKHLTNILEKADRLRRLRRYAMGLGEAFLQSVFLEMFYKEASEKWPREKVSSLAKKGKNSIRTGPFGSQLKHSEFIGSGIRVLGIDNAVKNRFEWGKPRFISQAKYEKLKRYTVYPGDVIITIMGTLGRCAIIPDDIPLTINTKHLCCISLDQERCLPVYLKHCFLGHPTVLSQLGVSERGAIMPGLNMGIIKELTIPLPPMTLQKKFLMVVHKHEQLLAQQEEALRQAEHLFQSLLHRAFRGEL